MLQSVFLALPVSFSIAVSGHEAQYEFLFQHVST